MVASSLDLVESMFRILRARGMDKPERENRHDFDPVEKELGCSLPEDFKAIMQASPDLVSWGIGGLSFMTPQKMLKCQKQLQGAYPKCSSLLDWSNDKSLVVFGSNSSAFYYFFVKESGKLSKIARMDGEGSMEYSDRMACDLSLAELLFRMIVRAVDSEIWEKHGSTASEFWHSASEAEDMEEGEDCSARDGSQDHAASHDGRIVVLGRPVVWVGHEDIDEDEEEDYPTASVFQGASEEDFLRLGTYGVTHPLDQEEEDRQKAIDNAAKQTAAVDMTHFQKATTKDLGFDDDLTSLINKDIGTSLAKSALIRQRVAAGERSAAFIGVGGKLAIFDMQDERLWWSQEANGMLEEGEEFTHVSIGGQQHGFALTSRNRLLQWNALGEKTMNWVELPPNLGRITQLDSLRAVVALVLEDGRVLKGKNPEFLNCSDAVTAVSMGDDGLLLLHKDGSVSRIDAQGGVEKIPLSEKAIAIVNAGSHRLFLSIGGAVFGTGGREALPIAVTPGTIEAYEASRKKFEEQLKLYEEKLDAFTKLMEEHCQKCQTAIEQRAKKTRHNAFIPPSMKEDPRQLILFKIQCSTFVDGVEHTPEKCGAPAKPSDLNASDLITPLPSETTFERSKGYREPVSEPMLLTVGSEHERVKSSSASLTPKGSWNSVEGPYNFHPGSTSPVLAIGGSYGFSVFLHQDGTLSGCGNTGRLSLGFKATTDDDDDDDVEGDDRAERPKIKIITQHSYSQKHGHVYIPTCGEIGMPVAAEFPSNTKIVSFDTGHAGTLAIDQDGQIWGCGFAVGRSCPASSYELLSVLDKGPVND